jgi:GNAT superfamily N-acetyltransferase
MLDNPAWNSLVGRQAHLALGSGRVRRYPADVAPFLATGGDGPGGRDEMADLAAPGEWLYMVAAEPSPPPGWQVERTSAVSQMVGDRPIETTAGAEGSALGPDDVPDMLELTALAFPGFFRPRSIAMGTYLGIREEDGGRLVAMAGLRMAPEGYREISGICTHPAHRGRGHARRLVARLVYEILGLGLRPFLHVDGANAGAHAAYEKLGFAPRRDLTLLRVRRL